MMCGKLLREEQQGRSGFEALLCPNCGAEYHPGDKFCMMCSQPLEGAADGAGR